ncbi:MAG: putative metal-binding motif-containing protein [Patescibacteria group bacterium]
MNRFSFRSLVAPILTIVGDSLPSIPTVAVSGVLALVLTGCNLPSGDCTKSSDGFFGTATIVLDCGKADTGNTVVDSGDTGDSVPDSNAETGETDSGEIDETNSDTDTAAQPTDADGDGFNTDDDCNDHDTAINPDATEICDGVDNNCDDVIDTDAADQTTYYADTDSDGYGDATVIVDDCSAPAGYVEDDTDCDDADATIHPYADEDCTAMEDLNCDGSFGYADADGDLVPACEDCDDTNANAYPGNTEVCDGVDNDCEDTVDEDAADELTWYEDLDGDTYGDSDSTTFACDEPIGYVADSADCDDAAATVNPGAAEVCNDVDDDCDGGTDEDLAVTVYYTDADGDGYGAGSGSSECADPGAGYSTVNTDCDDTNGAINPAAVETCDGEDNDCEGTVDEGAVDALTWFADGDNDGHGNAAISVLSCSEPSGYTADDTDCDDTDNDVYPGDAEWCDGKDNDCDGVIDINDGDGDGVDACSGDCDDGDAAEFPGNPEVCDGLDNDCDGGVDDGLTGTYYRDSDGDTYGDPSVSTTACSAPSGYVSNNTDCDDGDSGINPGGTEVVGNGVDDDCSGTELVFTTDFGMSTGVCRLDGAYTSTGAAVRQAGGCYIWVEGYGSLTAPAVSVDIDVAGLTAGDEYIFSWDVGNASASTTTFVGAFTGSSIESLSLGTGTSGVLEDIVTVGSTTVTASIWHTGTNDYDGYLTGFTVER